MEEKYESLWGHLDALRKTFIQTLLIFGIGFIFLLCFYQPLLKFLTAIPVEKTHGLTTYKIERRVIENELSSSKIELPHDSLWISGGQGIFPHYLLAPHEKLVYDQAIRSPLLILGPLEALILVFKACFWLSIALTAPFWGWAWLQFILPGIRSNEKAILFPFLFGSMLCIALGSVLAYKVTLPLANEYLSFFNHSIGQNAWTLNLYVNYVLLLCLGHAIAAEISFLLLVLVHFRFLSAEWLISKRRYMIVMAFILGALLTPPDVLTQILMAIPLMGVYECAILYAKWRSKSVIRVKKQDYLT